MPEITQASPEKILIVEDDPVSLKSLIALFSRDFDITVATNGKDCLSLVNPSYKLFLLDLQLPDIHGFEILKKIQEDAQLASIPAIFITANQDISTEEAGIRLGAVDFITKPFSPAVLRARVKLHLDLRRKSEMLEILAREDGLTGLANRRQFDDVFDLEWRRSMREQTPLAVIMSDIDRFKNINDTYGHPMGDATLKAAAGAMAKQIYRPSDFIARYGGEEFVVILHNTCLEGAVQVAERIRAAVEEAFCAPSAELPKGVTISLGAASAVPREGDGADLILAADMCLKRAKENGRNRVES